jgi:hypothetical protein
MKILVGNIIAFLTCLFGIIFIIFISESESETHKMNKICNNRPVITVYLQDHFECVKLDNSVEYHSKKELYND